jgi:hypothetical protein
MPRSVFSAFLLLITVLLVGCDGESNTGDNTNETECSISTDVLVSGGVSKDGIPALTNPLTIPAAAETYLSDESRVIGLLIDGQPLAIPHNILWWHEIVNLDAAGEPLAVTYCPLTGSSLAFDRTNIGGREFGVSGLLFQNNLTMYDRGGTDESLWPQMNRAAGCGSLDGTTLTMAPVVEMSWAGWRSLHPTTEVLSNQTGFNRNYTAAGYPYGDYESLNNARLLFAMPIDDRRPPKERVLGVPAGDGGAAYPFGLLDDGSVMRAIADTVGGEPIVVFWDLARRAAMAYRPTLGGAPLSFEVREGRIVDTMTQSAWEVDGRAVEGPRAGERLEPVAEAYVAFWFAWATFQPETRIWGVL